VLANELIKEFADRCLSASRSIQEYMKADNPAPDNDTMESLIDVNEALQASLNQHQRAMLNAKKQMGADGSATPSPIGEGGAAGSRQNSTSEHRWPRVTSTGSSSQSSLQRQQQQQQQSQAIPSRGKGKAPVAGEGSGGQWEPSSAAGPSRSHTGTPSQYLGRHSVESDPFRDPEPAGGASSAVPPGAGYARETGGGSTANETPRYAHEPYHPGFSSGGAGAGAGAGQARRSGSRDSDGSSNHHDGYGAQQQQHQQRNSIHTHGHGHATSGGGGGGGGAGGASQRFEPVTPVSDDGIYDHSDGEYDPYRAAGKQQARAAATATGGAAAPAEPVYRY